MRKKHSMLVAAIVVLAYNQAGCSWLQKTAEPLVIDCAEQSSSSLAALLLVLKGDVPDWGKVESDAIAAIPKYGYKVAGCVLAQLVQKYMTAPENAGSGTQAHNVFEDFRLNHAGNSSFRIGGQDL